MSSNSTYYSSPLVHTLLSLILIATPHYAFADESNGWEVTISPYLWVTGQEGEVATLPPAAPAELDISFSDVLEDLDMTLMGIVLARKDRIGIFGELFYVTVSPDVDTADLLYTGGDYDQDVWAISLGVSYALLQSDGNILDAVVGVRHWNLENELKLDAGILPAIQVKEEESWNDTFAGLLWQTRLGESWYLTAWGMTAVAGDSDSHWDAYAAIGYDYSDSFSLSAGYRHQEVDYKNDDFLYDIKLSGPIIGLVFRL